MKRRVNITIDETLHDWSVERFGEREFSKLIDRELKELSSSYRDMDNSPEKISGEKSMREIWETDVAKLIDKAQKQKKDPEFLYLEGGTETPEFRAAQTKEFEAALDLAQKYEDSEEGYPMPACFTEKDAATVKRLAENIVKEDRNARYNKICARVNRILDVARHELIQELMAAEELTERRKKIPVEFF